MSGLTAGIHAETLRKLLAISGASVTPLKSRGVDGRDEPGHDCGEAREKPLEA